MPKLIKATAQTQNRREQFKDPPSTMIFCMPNEKQNLENLCQKELSDAVKTLLSPQGGAYLFLDSPEGNLLERGGGLFKKLDENEIYDSFINLLPHVLYPIFCGCETQFYASNIHTFDTALYQTISN